VRHRNDRRRFYEAWALIALAVLATVVATAQGGGQSQGASQMPPGSTEVIQSGSAKPIVLYVGPRFLFAHAHIRGAESIGAALESQALEKLRKRVATLPRNSFIVLYCGCCPWDHCPNIRPAYKELQKMGFTKLKALYLATSFGTDWADKGYPVEKGE
jgi:thiosulfate/3-mercaptopyruvate sulfurtransferase